MYSIAPDIYGVAEVYCVQILAYFAVESSGRGGSVKHWGSLFGCQSVDSAVEWVGWAPWDSNPQPAD